MTEPLSTYLALFRAPERARRDLERLQALVSADWFTAAVPLLSESPNPDQALSLLERLLSHGSPELIALLDHDRVLLHYSIVVLGHSYWLGEALLQNSDLFYSLQREKNLECSLEPQDFHERLDRFRAHFVATDVSLLLARFKKREYVRIALRDILGIATLAETTAEISSLTDVLIAAALREAEVQMRLRYGNLQVEPGSSEEVRFAVLSLGKLGGNELNYSSDVDLLYLFSGAEVVSGEISLREYFVRQAQIVTDILSRATSEGAVFRIDLRLRPQGHEGEPAVALHHALDYYANAAHDWELQALIKARHSAGDLALAREFIRDVQRRVYTPNINFAAIETAVNSRDKIGAHRRRVMARRKRPATIDVKLDRGGIRDIEFLVQCLQRAYGGEEQWLRAGGTLFSLQKLNDKGHLDARDFHELSQAYEFLRTIEHRLQLQRGQQVHSLPADLEELAVLARAVDHDFFAGTNAFVERLHTLMARVAAIYDRIIHSQQQREQKQPKTTGGETSVRSSRRAGQESSLEQMLERIGAESPALRHAILQRDLSVHARRNLHRFLSAAMTSAERYAVLLENPGAIARAAALFEASDYLTDVLVRHPDAARVLNQLQSPETHPAAAARPSLDAALDGVNSFALLRKNYRELSFAIAVHDSVSPRPALLSMQESSRLADRTIQCALRMVQGARSLVIFALGRLGTGEFDIASDADLLFVRAPEADEDEARLDAERLVNALAAYTREGSIFAVDARLRPHGGEGELVVSAEQVERYLAEEAQPWEALTYSKLRFVAGREDLAPRVLTAVWHQIVEIATRPGFSAAVLEMRGKLEKSNRYSNSFKLARGGLYDVDFIASSVMLREASLVSGNTLERLEALQQAGLLQASDFSQLREATQLYRTADHAIRLVTGRARPELPASEHQRHATESMVARILDWQAGHDLQSELQATQERVRRIFTSIIHA